MTLEAFPSETNYRNLGDVFNRPTIEQLMEGKVESKDAEKGDDEADKGLALTSPCYLLGQVFVGRN